MQKIEMLEAVKQLISPVYLVGGSVRDMLRDRTPKDFDFTTPLTPEEIEITMMRMNKKVYNIGKRFGTLGVKINGQMVEITTFRRESYMPGSRKPQVNFVKDITADLSRRDFTINAMAVKDDYKLIDPFNGQIDIHERKIRAVGNPVERISEDPLRMLRAARFASQLNFELDWELIDAIKRKAHKILEVSKERWVMELDKLLLTIFPHKGLEILASTQLLNYMIPELSLQVRYNQNNPHHSQTLWNHTKLVVMGIEEKDINLRWAALLHDIAKPFTRTENPKGYSNYINHDRLGKEMVERIALHLKWSNERREKVSYLVENHLREDSPLKKADQDAK